MGSGYAHGRVNIVGEHTDYNAGLVLPALIAPRTTVEVRTRTDRRIALRSEAQDGTVETSLDERAPRRDWSDYVVGVVDVLVRRGLEVRGFDAEIRSTIPPGAGLASSAALCVASARALRDAFGLALDEREIALVAHEAEDRFVGAHVGLMDQLVCAIGREGGALFIDIRDRETRDLPLGSVDIAVVDSGIRHDNAAGEYNARRRECEEAAQALGVGTLREVHDADALARLDPTLRRRARHVVTENDRVRRAVDALERGDVATLGAIVNLSHESLRDDFDVSVPPIDAIVAAAQRDPDVYGARITGAGFGGSVLVLARPGTGRAAAERAVKATSGRVVVP